MVYIMSDIHGCYDEFIEMLEKIDFKDEDTLYILGDVIDRGPEPIKVLDYIMNHKNIEMILGNHEFMMLDYFKEKEYGISSKSFKYAKDLWLRNGGEITLEKLGECSEEKINEYIEFIKNLPYFKVLESKKDKYLLVHAGISPYDLPLKENIQNQTLDDLLWVRDDFLMSEKKLSFTIIFGHTPTQNAYKKVYMVDKMLQRLKVKDDFLEKYTPNKIIYFNNKIGIDCGLVFGLYLGCIKLNLTNDEIEEYYILNKNTREMYYLN